MPDLVWLKTVVRAILLPPAGPLLLALLGIAILQWRPRAGRLLAASGVLALFILSMPAIAVLLVRALDTSPPLSVDLAQAAQAVVIPGGGTRIGAAEYGGDTLSVLSLERVRYGARVAKMTGLPVLVTGGSTRAGQPEAQLMRRALEDEFGVAVRWSEERSRTTHENAVYSAAILRAAGISKVILVAHSFDMRRARAEFEAQGLDIVAAPTAIPSSLPLDRLGDYWPSVAALQVSYYALYELLANVVFQLTERPRAGTARNRATPASSLVAALRL